MTAAAAPDLDSRYGRTRGSRRRRTVIAVVAGAAVLAASIAWVVWVGIFSPASSLESRDLGYTSTETDVTISWELTVPAGAASSCALQALNETFAVVGWKVVEVPPSDARTRQLEHTIRTSEPAVTGLIYRCWLT